MYKPSQNKKVKHTNILDKFMVKIPKISTNPTHLPVRTLLCQRLRSSRDVRQKKGPTFQASWKGKYAWIVYDAAKYKVFFEVCSAAKNMGAPLPSTTYDQESFRAIVLDGFSSWAKALERFQHNVTSCTSELSFSGLWRLNTWKNLQSMGQARLNHVTILNYHKTLSRSKNCGCGPWFAFILAFLL